ncbi:hypothetical protein M8J76_013790 [Diaphorina citri]|nr:hypothetical protein M8J76_013790 [Diaphorina citri]
MENLERLHGKYCERLKHALFRSLVCVSSAACLLILAMYLILADEIQLDQVLVLSVLNLLLLLLLGLSHTSNARLLLLLSALLISILYTSALSLASHVTVLVVWLLVMATHTMLPVSLCVAGGLGGGLIGGFIGFVYACEFYGLEFSYERLEKRVLEQEQLISLLNEKLAALTRSKEASSGASSSLADVVGGKHVKRKQGERSSVSFMGSRESAAVPSVVPTKYTQYFASRIDPNVSAEAFARDLMSGAE